MSFWVESSARIFGRFQGVIEMCRFYPVDTVEYLSSWGHGGGETRVCALRTHLSDLSGS